jgi:hypothetical protein
VFVSNKYFVFLSEQSLLRKSLSPSGPRTAVSTLYSTCPGVLVYLAIQRIINANYEIDALVMLITSGVGVLVNIVMGCR